MPEPRENEDRNQFVSRCISYLMNKEGVRDKSHAAAKCHGIWKQSKK